MLKAVLSMCLAVAILGGGACLLFGDDYTCPTSTGRCSGQTCPMYQVCVASPTAAGCYCNFQG